MQVQDHTVPGVAEGRPDGTVTERLADHVSALRFDDLPSDVVGKVKDLLVHHLGLAFRGHADPGGEQALRAARFLSADSGSCTLIGERQPATLLDAVFANAHLMNHMGMDDFLMPPGVHPGILTHPVGLAVGELEHSSGRDYITAVVAGYDVTTKLAAAMFPWNLPLPRRPYALYGTFASATVAARLFRLSGEQTAQALAHAAQVGVGLIEGDTFGSVPSQNTRNGVMAAVLARVGMPELPTMIEGEHGLYRSYCGEVPDELESSLSTLGDEFEILNANTKRYPTTGLNIVPLELTLDLMNRHAVSADDVARIDVLLPQEREQREMHWESEVMGNHEGRPPITAIGSLRFLMAGVITHGAIDPPGFVAHRNEQLDAMIEQIHLRFEPGHQSRFCRIEITTATDRFAAEGDDHIFPAPTWEEWLAEGGDALFSEPRLERLVELVTDLEHLEDVQQLTRCLVPE